MRTTDLFKINRSSKRLNESLEKTFGQKINFATFDTPKLEDARNKLRTQISQVRSQSGFNETIENEALTQAQWMHDAIVAELMDRQEHIVDSTMQEASGVDQNAVLQLLKTFDENMNEIGGYGDPDAGKIISLLKQGDVESAVELVWYAYSDQDGGELRNMDSYIDDLQAEFEDLAQGGFDPLKHVNNPTQGEKDAAPDVDRGSYSDRAAMLRSAEAGGRLKGESAPPTAKGERMVKHIKKGYAKDGKLSDKEKSIAYATAWKQHNKESIETGEDMTKLHEGEIQQASAIVSAKTMVDRVGRWIEELSGMENDTLLQLGDQIRDEMGQEQAKTFISSVAPAIQQALENLKSTREALATGVRTLTGEEQGAEMLGAEPAPDMGGDELGAVEPDAMNTSDEMGPPDDEFAAAEPAAGGLGDTGRAQRESIQRESIQRENRLLRTLAG